MKNKNALMFLIVALASIFIGFYSGRAGPMNTLVMNGYCADTGKIMTEKEKVLSALEQFNQSGRVSRVRDENGRAFLEDGYKYVPYSSPEEILFQNPGCCYVNFQETVDGKAWKSSDDDWNKTGRLKKEGRYAGHVILKFKATFRSEENGDEFTGVVRESGIISNCGKYNWMSYI